MARITVEDCLEVIDNQYDLVLLAKERTTQLNSGSSPLVSEDNDKRTIISLREIGDKKIEIGISLFDSTIQLDNTFFKMPKTKKYFALFNGTKMVSKNSHFVGEKNNTAIF